MATLKDKYYNTLLNTLVDDNNRKGTPLCNEKLRQTVGKVMEETEAEFERNINEITCDTSFQSPIQKKDVSTINDSSYYELDNQVDTIIDSNKQVDPSSNPKEETRIIDRIRKLSFRQILFKPAVIRVIGQDLVKNVQDNSSVELSLKSFSPFNTISSKEIVMGVACNIAHVDRNVRKSCTPVDRNIRNPSRVGTPEVNVDFFSPIHGSNSSFTKWSRNINPLDTSLGGYATQERNSDF